MPLVRIEVQKGRLASEREQLLDAVHDALVETFGIPEDDRTQRLIEHDPESFEIDPGRSERYTLVEITAFPGRSGEAKRDLYAAIVRNLEAIGTPADDVPIVLHEPPTQNWGIRGGHPANEIDLGYRFDV
jgi:phenylpyruvate tautomerase PptA (4-oxalocrotonate tautomerase family)